MNLPAVALITAIAMGLVRLHFLTTQFQLLLTAQVSQGDRILGMSNGILLLPLPILLMLLWSTKAKLRVSEFDRALSIVAALALAVGSMLPGMFTMVRAARSIPPAQVLWIVAGLFAQLMSMVFLLTLASLRDEPQPFGMAPAIDPPTLRTTAAVAVGASAINIVIQIVVTAMIFTDTFGSADLRFGYLTSRFISFVAVVVSFVMAWVIYRSARGTHYETGVVGGRG